MGGRAAIRRLAANAVIAGCKPEYFPVVVTAIEALLERQVNVGGTICSMQAAIPLGIVNGPIRHRIGLNCGFNVFGQGWRANATIGRAVQLSLVNLGGAKPGNFTFCIAENEEESPKDPLHVERGLRREDTAVTVIGAGPPHARNNQASEHPRDLLHTLTTMMANAASMNAFLQGGSVLVHAPEHAHLIARFGWTKNDVRQYLFEHVSTPIADLKRGGVHGPNVDRYAMWPSWLDRDAADERVPMARRPSDFLIVVVAVPGNSRRTCQLRLPARLRAAFPIRPSSPRHDASRLGPGADLNAATHRNGGVDAAAHFG